MIEAAIVILQILAGLLFLISVLPLIKIPYGALRGLAFPRVQLFWAALLLMVPTLALQGLSVAFWLLMAVALIQVIYIAKFTPLWRRQSIRADASLTADNRRHIRLLTANVKMSNRAYDRLIDLTRETEPDILMAIETDQRWCDALVGALGEEYPHRVEVPRDNGYGICMMSRLPLVEAEVRDLITDGVASVRTIVTLRSGAQIRLYLVHPEPPVVSHDTIGRDSEIAVIGMEAAKDRLPTIVTGDLNDVAWSTTTRRFQRLSGLADPRVGRGFFNTFHADHVWARWPLDHLFHDPIFRLLSVRRLPKIGSDHFPMYFELALAQEEIRSEEIGSADAAEKAEVRKMVAEERVRDRDPIGDDWESED